ncbi:22550_t:CDS:2 [Cetraspora pellucida]|uniref:22550_t:CDS:1 n=1 Tax=Cetraspora pellucida TaxID=1433469 RepID=A0A9N9G8D5_9GLOM|nr:22550_t:CDS:2 [Cetraspora pellucida]
MPCYADTIVRIKHVRRNKKEDSRTFSLWAIGAYPIGTEDLEMEMTLPMPINPDDRDPDSQALFKRDEYFSVGGKIVPGTYAGNKRLKMLVTNSTNISIDGKASNKCPMKVSLVGIPQKMPLDIRHTENSVIDLLVSDYLLHQQYNYIVKVVFPHVNQFKHYKTSVRPHESILFVVGQLEIIDNEIYVYARELSYIDSLSTKKKDYEPNNHEVTLITTNTTRSKLLYAHKNAFKNSDVKYSDDTQEEIISSTSTGSEYFESMYQDDLSGDDDLPDV